MRIAAAGRERVDDLRPLFLALHDYHRSVSALPLTEPDARAWAERRATYERHFDEDRALLHVADGRAQAVGYAFTILHDGTDDTFCLAPRYAELYTLTVAPPSRGAGVGSRLLDAVEASMEAIGVRSLLVAAMAGNQDAIRFYRRRGLVPGELLLYRLDARP